MRGEWHKQLKSDVGEATKKSICELVASSETKAIVNVCTSPTINIMFHFGFSSLIYHLIKFNAPLRARHAMTGKMWRMKKKTHPNHIQSIWRYLRLVEIWHSAKWNGMKKSGSTCDAINQTNIQNSVFAIDFRRIDRPKQLELTLRASDANPKQCHHQRAIEMIKWSERRRRKKAHQRWNRSYWNIFHSQKVFEKHFASRTLRRGRAGARSDEFMF